MTTDFQTPFSRSQVSLIEAYRARHGREQWNEYAKCAGERAAYLHANYIEIRDDPRIADVVAKPLGEQARVLDLPVAHIEIERTNEGYVHRDTAYPVKEMVVAAQLREEGWCVIHDEGATFCLLVHALAQDVMSRIYFLLHPEELQEYVPGGYWRLDDWKSLKGQHLFWALAKRFITLRAGPHEEALHHDCVRAIQTAMQRAATFEDFKSIIERNLAYHPGKLAAMQERIDLAWQFLHCVPETFWSAYLHHAMLPGWNTDGWPDLTCVKDGRVRLVEIKGRDKLKTSQVVWCSTTRHVLPVTVDIIRVKGIRTGAGQPANSVRLQLERTERSNP